MNETSNAELRARYSAMQSAILAIENRVKQLDLWAEESAAKKDYSSANSHQKAAVDLHCAVEIVREAVFPHKHKLTGFSWLHGDTCPGCELDSYLDQRRKGR